MDKIIIFDWGGVIMHKFPAPNNDNEAIIRTIKSFNSNLTDDEAWNIYVDTLTDEFGTYISAQDDNLSIEKWIKRIMNAGKFQTTVEEFSKMFILQHKNVGYYKDVVEYIYSLKDNCKIGLLSDLIFCCKPVLESQVDLSKFDYVGLSYKMHLRKDKTDIFKVVEKQLNISPENILFVDDKKRNIINAQNCGLNVCNAEGYELDKIKKSVNEFLGN